MKKECSHLRKYIFCILFFTAYFTPISSYSDNITVKKNTSIQGGKLSNFKNGVQFVLPRRLPLSLRNGPADYYNVSIILNKNVILKEEEKIENWCLFSFNQREAQGWAKCNEVSRERKVGFLIREEKLQRLPGNEPIGKLNKGSKVNIIACGERYCRVSLVKKKLFGINILRGWLPKNSLLISM